MTHYRNWLFVRVHDKETDFVVLKSYRSVEGY